MAPSIRVTLGTDAAVEPMGDTNNYELKYEPNFNWGITETWFLGIGAAVSVAVLCLVSFAAGWAFALARSRPRGGDSGSTSHPTTTGIRAKSRGIWLTHGRGSSSSPAALAASGAVSESAGRE